MTEQGGSEKTKEATVGRITFVEYVDKLEPGSVGLMALNDVALEDVLRHELDVLNGQETAGSPLGVFERSAKAVNEMMLAITRCRIADRMVSVPAYAKHNQTAAVIHERFYFSQLNAGKRFYMGANESLSLQIVGGLRWS